MNKLAQAMVKFKLEEKNGTRLADKLKNSEVKPPEIGLIGKISSLLKKTVVENQVVENKVKVDTPSEKKQVSNRTNIVSTDPATLNLDPTKLISNLTEKLSQKASQIPSPLMNPLNAFSKLSTDLAQNAQKLTKPIKASIKNFKFIGEEAVSVVSGINESVSTYKNIATEGLAIFENVKKTVSEYKKLTSEAISALDKIGIPISKVINLGKVKIQTFKEMGQAAKTSSIRAGQSVIEMSKSIGVSSLNASKALGSGLIAKLNKAKTVVTSFASRIIPMMIAGVRSLSLAFMTNPIGIAIAGIALAGGLLISNWEPVKQFFTEIWTFVQPIWEVFIQTVKDLWNGFTDNLKIGWEFIKQFFIVIWTPIQPIWQEFIKTMKVLWNGFTDNLKIGWEFIKQFFIVIWTPIQPIWQEFIKTMKVLWNGFTDNLKISWEFIKQFFIVIWTPIQPIWQAFIKTMKDLWNGFTDNLKIGWESIKQFFTIIWASVQPIWEVFVKTIKDLWSGFTDNLKMGWESIKQLFTGIWRPVQPIWEGFLNSVGNIWDKLTNKFIGFGDVIKKYVIKPFDSVFQYIKKFNDAPLIGKVISSVLGEDKTKGEAVIPEDLNNATKLNSNKTPFSKTSPGLEIQPSKTQENQPFSFSSPVLHPKQDIQFQGGIHVTINASESEKILDPETLAEDLAMKIEDAIKNMSRRLTIDLADGH